MNGENLYLLTNITLFKSVTIYLENLADVAAFNWLTSMPGGKQPITYHLYIFGAINSNFKLKFNQNFDSYSGCSRGLRPSTRPSK